MDRLPREIQGLIFGSLNEPDLLCASLVCKLWFDIAFRIPRSIRWYGNYGLDESFLNKANMLRKYRNQYVCRRCKKFGFLMGGLCHECIIPTCELCHLVHDNWDQLDLFSGKLPNEYSVYAYHVCKRGCKRQCSACGAIQYVYPQIYEGKIKFVWGCTCGGN